MTPEQTSILLSCLQLAGTIIVIAIVLVRNNILKTQIEKQNAILTSFEKYSNAIDIDRITKFVEMSRKTHEMEFEEKLNLSIKEFEIAKKELTEEVDKINTSKDSVLTALTETLLETSHIMCEYYSRTQRLLMVPKFPASVRVTLMKFITDYQTQHEPNSEDKSLNGSILKFIRDKNIKIKSNVDLEKDSIWKYTNVKPPKNN